MQDNQFIHNVYKNTSKHVELPQEARRSLGTTDATSTYHKRRNYFMGWTVHSEHSRRVHHTDRIQSSWERYNIGWMGPCYRFSDGRITDAFYSDGYLRAGKWN